MTIFKKIIDRQIPAEIVFEDERCLAFKDNSPQAPVHILVIPKKEIQSIAHLQDEDSELMGHIMSVIRNVAKEQGLDEGYRVITNIGPAGGQSVDHLHFHVMGGRDLGWPPG